MLSHSANSNETENAKLSKKVSVPALSHVPTKTALSSTIKLNHELATIQKEGVCTPLDLENFATKVWRTHLANEQRTKQLEQEIDSIKRFDHEMWTRFQKVIDPGLHIHEGLVPIYSELSNIMKGLQKLSRSQNISQESFTARLVSLQTRLHTVEDSKIETVMMPESSSLIPGGQAVISSLMNRCYRMIRILSTRDDLGPKEPPSKVEEINHSLVALLSAFQAGYEFDSILLTCLAEEVRMLESAKVNGEFVEADGSIAPNQEYIQKEITLAHELINDCMSYLDPQFLRETQTPDKDLEAIIEKIQDVRHMLKWKVEEEVPSSTLTDFRKMMVGDRWFDLQEPVMEGMSFIEKKTEVAVGAAGLVLGNLVQTTLGMATKVLETLDPIDPALLPTYKKVLGWQLTDQLETATDELKDIRNRHNWDLLQQKNSGTPPAKIYDKYGKDLTRLDEELAKLNAGRVGGEWVDATGEKKNLPGQDLLNNSFERANSLLRSLLFK
ncbi:hypothetical protein HDU91_007204 [Kappamyces sp. JEL0680]|nr:hypothetical protein HDU91_007204 [Kappamyces sp. JEL0680]